MPLYYQTYKTSHPSTTYIPAVLDTPTGNNLTPTVGYQSVALPDGPCFVFCQNTDTATAFFAITETSAAPANANRGFSVMGGQASQSLFIPAAGYHLHYKSI